MRTYPNENGITKMEFTVPATVFCPLGPNYYRGTVTAEVELGDKIVDFLDLEDYFKKELNGKELTTEALCPKGGECMKNEIPLRKERFTFLQVLLTVISVSCLLISNVITSKQVLFPFGITMTGGVFIFPITYILSDVFSEVYGYRWSRITCYFGFAMNLLMSIMFELVIMTPAPSYWGNQEAFATVLGNAPRVLVASLSAFVVGDFVNDVVFKKMKAKHQNEIKGFGWRAIISSFFGEVADSLVFIPIAFLGQMPFDTLVQMLIVQVILKTGYELLILPLTTLVVKKVSAYEQRV